MDNAQNISAEQMSNKSHVKAEGTKSISQIKNKMEENNLLAIPVVNEKNKFIGAIGYRDLIRHVQFNPESTKLEKVMHQPPEYDNTDNLIELANLRINSGRKMLVNLEGNKLKGVIGEQEFLEALNQTEEVEDISTRDIATYEVLTVFEEDSVEQARHKLLDNNISRLPVLDNDGNLVGKISSIDMLKMLVPREGVNPGGNTRTKQSENRGGNEKDKMSGITVEEVMDRTPTVMEGHGESKDAIQKMIDEESKEVIITDREYPEAILTVKDFLRHFNDKYNVQETVLVNLIGLEVDEEKAAVHNKIETQLRGSLGRKLDRPEELSLHVKKSEKDGKKHRHEIVAKLYSEFGITTSNVEEWELLDAVDTALDELNTQIRKKKEKQEEKR
jgi:CBS domain-containing protein/ribosome-associated translation inhibitor RaiA